MQNHDRKLIVVIGVLSVIIVIGGVHIAKQPKAGLNLASVTSLSPDGEVPLHTNFTFEFSRPVASANSTLAEVETPPVDFSPPIPGKFRWVAPDRLRFYPEVSLAPSTVYTAAFSPAIAQAQQKTFQTPRFRVNSARLQFAPDSEQRGSARIRGTIQFNYPVDLAALREYLSVVYDDGAEIPYEFKTKGPTAGIVELETVEVERGEADQRIRLRIEKDFKCVDGEIGLEQAYVKPIVLKARPDLVIHNAYVQQAGTGFLVQIEFSAPVDAQMARQYVTLQPYVTHATNEDYRFTTEYHYLQIRGNLTPRDRYGILIKPGLMSIDGAILRREFTQVFAIPDLEPNVRVVGDGLYLPRSGNLNIGIATINLNRVEVEIEKVFANNIVYLASAQNWRRWTNNIGKPVHQEELELESVLNEEVTTPLSLKDYISGVGAKHASPLLGVFKITVRSPHERWRSATQWVMITDMGIMAKRTNDELWVWVNSLASLEPVADAKITLISHNNQTLLTGTTDAEGLVKFEGVSEKIKDFSPFMITAEKGGDLSFVELDRRQIPTGDFNVTGAPYLNQGYEAFLYTDRGVYRPGETANLVALVRGNHAAVPPELPTLLQLLGPDGRIVRELRSQTDSAGACEFNISLETYFKTGGYTARLLVADREIGRGRLLGKRVLRLRGERHDLGQRPTGIRGGWRRRRRFRVTRRWSHPRKPDHQAV